MAEPERPGWHEYFLSFARLAAKRSTCLRRHVGAVAVRDHFILATGYNGAPTNQPHCEKTGCIREELKIPSGQRHEICNALHAEQNVICQAALHGMSLKGARLYITHRPCYICAKMLVQVQIGQIIFIHGYPDDQTTSFLKSAGVSLIMINDKVYDD